jgi:hypothetical protein
MGYGSSLIGVGSGYFPDSSIVPLTASGLDHHRIQPFAHHHHNDARQEGCDPRLLSRNHTPDLKAHPPIITNNGFTSLFKTPECLRGGSSDDASGEEQMSEEEDELASSSESSDTAAARDPSFIPIVPSHPLDRRSATPASSGAASGSGLVARTHRITKAPEPVPVPNLTKKSRGRRVPIVARDIEENSTTRIHICHHNDCGKVCA